MKKIFLLCLAFFSLSLIFIYSRPTDETKAVTFVDVSRELTRELQETVHLSRGDLYRLDNSQYKDIRNFAPSAYVCAGLEYDIHTTVFPQKLLVSSTQEAFKIHSTIYKSLLPKINAIRNLRPYLAESPLTPKSFVLTLCFGDGTKPHYARPPFFLSLMSGHTRDAQTLL